MFTIEEARMPKATTPEEISQLIGDAISSGDLEAALSLYGPEATFVMPRALGEGSVTGLAALREAISQFLDISPKLTVNTERTVLAGDTALVIGNWTLTGRDPNGHEIAIAGRYADVVRRQPDGSWLFVIDNPNGSD